MYVYGEKKADLLAQSIKVRFGQIPIIYGGPQATLQSERIIKQDWVDMICRGEGEKALLSLCNAIEAKTSFDHVPNLWMKKNNGTINKNDIGSLLIQMKFQSQIGAVMIQNTFMGLLKVKSTNWLL